MSARLRGPDRLFSIVAGSGSHLVRAGGALLFPDNPPFRGKQPTTTQVGDYPAPEVDCEPFSWPGRGTSNNHLKQMFYLIVSNKCLNNWA
jgi:hypothetical protein